MTASYIGKFFEYNGKTYEMIESPGERKVEMPIFKDIITDRINRELSILEIGNVTRIHFPEFSDHLCIDKYEEGHNVLNIDIIDFYPEEKYDFVYSISTIEHIGLDWGEKRDEKKGLIAVQHILKEIVRKGGEFVFSIPLGQNPITDMNLVTHFPKMRTFFIYQYELHEWKQVQDVDIAKVMYNHPFPLGNVVLIGHIFND